MSIGDRHKVVTGYGIVLRRLTEDKIELVRRWRNDPKISQYMEYREYITEEMQKRWFNSIDNENNYYFIIEIDGNEVGLDNFKNIDYAKGIGESGIFIYDDRYLNGPYSFRTTLCAFDFFFETLKLKEIHGHVLRDNKRALRYNKAFGFSLLHGQDDLCNQEYMLDYQTYVEARKKLLNLIK